MTLPNQWDLDHEILPQLRKLIVRADPENNPQSLQDALFGLLGLVSDLSAEVNRLRAS